jgi:hypothetical protein
MVILFLAHYQTLGFEKKLFWVFHIGYQPSNFNVQGLGGQICKNFE